MREIHKIIYENKKVGIVVDWFLPEVTVTNFPWKKTKRKTFLQSFCNGRIDEY